MPELASVRVVATSNITAVTSGGTATVDGVALSIGDEVLLAGQTDGAKNGIRVVSASPWPRRADQDASGEFVQGNWVYVRDGSEWGGSRWGFIGVPNPTLESSMINWHPFARDEVERAGTGLEEDPPGQFNLASPLATNEVVSFGAVELDFSAHGFAQAISRLFGYESYISGVTLTRTSSTTVPAPSGFVRLG